MMSNWRYLYNLSPRGFSKLESEDGVSISTYPSPYDVPEAVRSIYDRNNRRLSIEFQYIGDEPLKKEPEDAGVFCQLGKNSGRLYAIDLFLDKAKVENDDVEGIKKLIEQTIHKLLADTKRPTRVYNYTMAQEALKIEKDSLFAALVVPMTTGA